jgi:hypothetical protein
VTLSDNRVAGDTLSRSYTSASFADKNVGTAKTVSVSGISISGADAANYAANTTASTTADITGKALVVSATGVNKVYDGSTNATVTLSDNASRRVLSTSHTARFRKQGTSAQPRCQRQRHRHQRRRHNPTPPIPPRPCEHHRSALVVSATRWTSFTTEPPTRRRPSRTIGCRRQPHATYTGEFREQNVGTTKP